MLYVLLMAIVCAIAVGHPDAAAGPNDTSLANAVWPTVVCVILPVAIALFAVGANRPSAKNAAAFEKRSIWLLRLHGLTWLIAALGTVYWARWPEVVRHGWGRWILIDELLIVAPLLVSWLASWAVFYDWFSHEVPPIPRARFVWNQCRLSLLLAWFPVLMFCSIHDVIRVILPAIEETQTSLVAFGVNMVGLLVFFPRVLGWIWETKPLPPGALRSCLFRMAEANGLYIREIHVWQTDHRIANAAVVGVFPWTRRVFLSDALLDNFTEHDVEAAFAHELGHALHHHSLFRMVLLVVPLSLAMLIRTLGPMEALHAGQDVSIPAVIAIATYLILALGWYSRRLEHEADLWACQQLSMRLGTPMALCQYVDVLSRLCDPRHVRRGSWLHPGHNRRRSFLIHCLSNLNRAKAFQSEMKWLAYFLVATALLPVLLLLAP
jgi:Zn-dependent protease with chaperone function